VVLKEKKVGNRWSNGSKASTTAGYRFAFRCSADSVSVCLYPRFMPCTISRSMIARTRAIFDFERPWCIIRVTRYITRVFVYEHCLCFEGVFNKCILKCTTKPFFAWHEQFRWIRLTLLIRARLTRFTPRDIKILTRIQNARIVGFFARY